MATIPCPACGRGVAPQMANCIHCLEPMPGGGMAAQDPGDAAAPAAAPGQPGEPAGETETPPGGIKRRRRRRRRR